MVRANLNGLHKGTYLNPLVLTDRPFVCWCVWDLLRELASSSRTQIHFTISARTVKSSSERKSDALGNSKGGVIDFGGR